MEKSEVQSLWLNISVFIHVHAFRCGKGFLNSNGSVTSPMTSKSPGGPGGPGGPGEANS